MRECKRVRAEKLLKRKKFLVEAVSLEQDNISNHIAALSQVSLFPKLFTRCAIGIVLFLFLFFFLKFLL
jgi:hypothetical protein